MDGGKAHQPLWLRAAATAAAVLLAVVLSPQVAASSPQYCRQLESQLASAGRPASGGQVRRYDQAIRAQELELEKTRTHAANAGCGRFLSGLGGQCSTLNATVARMEKNLATLRQQRSELGGGDPRREKARILAALDANGCRATREASLRDLSSARDRQAKLFNELSRTRQRDGNAAGAPRASAATGSYRTLCVRTCDGYFFPIAHSSSPKSFDRDAKACEAACPGTDVELFRHRVPAEEAAEAVSVRTGLPYTELPNAFAYRKTDYSRPSSCGCNVAKGFSVVAGAGYGPVITDKVVSASAAADTAFETKRLRRDGEPVPAAAEDRREAETAIAAAPDLFEENPAIEAEDVTSSVEDQPAERRIRVVGPMFLPDPEEAIDLRAPARRPAP